MFGFILGLIAGSLTPQAEAPLARPLAKAISAHVTVEPGELRLLSFMLVMLIAGVGAEVMHSGSAFWVVLGGALGFFATRIIKAAQAAFRSR